MKSKKVVSLLTVALLSSAVLFVAFKKGGSSTDGTNKYKVNFVLAKTSNELTAIRNNPNANILRTIKDFDLVLASHGTPLSKLSKEQINDFRKNLVERKGVGLVSLRFDGIQEALSYDDFALVMGMFGVDVKGGYWGLSKDPKIAAQLDGSMTATRNEKVRGASFFTDYEGYYCAGPHTCKLASGFICLTGC